MWLSVLSALVVLTAMFLFCAYIARLFFFRTHVRDGDSLANRLSGHGPHDEVPYETPRERLSVLWHRLRTRGTKAR